MPESTPVIAYCHSCGSPMDVTAVVPFTRVECPECGGQLRAKLEFGPYTLTRRHAVGGMSMVFAADDHTLDREVALKVLSEQYSSDERRIAAFEEEARITASLSHPNIVRVLRTGRAYGMFYIAMEFVPGGHFEHQIRERGRIPEAEMLPLAIEVAQGLKAAHAAGLIHRDIKPGNILLDAAGRARIVDFGLALVTQGGKARAAELWATPYYVPPETVDGAEEDFRSDIYAFGATLYHALAGVPSCGEESMATDVLREAKKRVIPLARRAPDVSEAMCRIVDKAMAHDPAGRFASYDEMLAALGAAANQLKSGQSRPAGASARGRKPTAAIGQRAVIATGAAAVLVAGLLVFRATRKSGPPPTPSADPAWNKPVATTTPPATDESAAIGGVYREARAALENGQFPAAALKFATLHRNPDFQEPSRTWAGVEAVLAWYCDGDPVAARAQAAEVHRHAAALAGPSGAIPAGVVAMLEALATPGPAPAPVGLNGAPAVVAGLLAGLHDWEQGLLGPAEAGFKAARAETLGANDSWAAPYQKLAGNYLADHAVLTGPLFEAPPPTQQDRVQRIEQLNQTLINLKTRGRARFNTKAWQEDLILMTKKSGNR
jgi:eukaryotic-like serine/threonine-protein kinase